MSSLNLHHTQMCAGTGRTTPLAPHSYAYTDKHALPGTIIPYELPEGADVRLSVFDVYGREVSVLVHETHQNPVFSSFSAQCSCFASVH